jgi:type II restriction enzyme
LTSEVLEVVKTYKTRNWKKEVEKLSLITVGKLSEVYLKERELIQIPVVLQNGEIIKLSAGKHNEVQAAIVEQFAPSFANGGTLLYLGDTAKKTCLLMRKL